MTSDLKRFLVAYAIGVLLLVGGLLAMSAAFTVKAANKTLRAQLENGITVLITQGKCDVRLPLESVKDEFKSQLKSGSATFASGRTRQLCWLVIDETVVVMDELGEVGEIPMKSFKPLPSA